MSSPCPGGCGRRDDSEAGRGTDQVSLSGEAGLVSEPDSRIFFPLTLSALSPHPEPLTSNPGDHSSPPVCVPHAALKVDLGATS